MTYNNTNIVLFGKLGHGKTKILNKICATNFPSRAGLSSCTRTLQVGFTRQSRIACIDTPSLETDEDLKQHIAAQKVALDGCKLSGVYLVIKIERAGVMKKFVDFIKDFLRTADIRLIVTFCDTLEGCNISEMRIELSKKINVDVKNIFMSGKDTTADKLEDFIHKTLHTPIKLRINENQVAMLASLSPLCDENFEKAINKIYNKIMAAENSIKKLTSQGTSKCYETDVAITEIQSEVHNMVDEGKRNIFMDAIDLGEDEQNIIYGKTGVRLTLRLQKFMQTSNSYLEWDVADPSDPRNQYKKCSCDAVFVKTEGCNHVVCGAVPSENKNRKPLVRVDFEEIHNDYELYFWINNIRYGLSQIRPTLQDWFISNSNKSQSSSGTNHMKRDGAGFESGCGATLDWNTMTPIEPALLKILSHVEMQHENNHERGAKSNFYESIRADEVKNKGILRHAGVI